MKLRDLELPFWFDAERPGASREQIEQLEKALGLALPDELRQALLLRDGGTSNYSSYQQGDCYIPIPAFLSVEELRRAEQHRERFDTPPGVLVIASGAHEWLGLDYRDKLVPSVVFQESEDSPLEIVAESFESLLDGLAED